MFQKLSRKKSKREIQCCEPTSEYCIKERSRVTVFVCFNLTLALAVPFFISSLVTAFTIEPRDSSRDGRDSPNTTIQRPIKALMTTYGYALPDPNQPNRLSTWFRGGTIEVWDEEEDMQAWCDIFGNLPKRQLKEKAQLFGRKIKTGVCPASSMEEDGKLSFQMLKPVGGHGVAYADVVYLDETLRILRGNFGTLYVDCRIPFPDE